MATIRIASFFTRDGDPATDIATVTPGYPKIRIWELDPTDVLLIGSPSGSIMNTDGIMLPLEEGATQDGFYYFDFTDILGYDETKSYVARCDGGSSLPTHERYQAISISAEAVTLTPEATQSIVGGVWNANTADYPTTGTTGKALSTVVDATDQLVLAMVDVLDLLEALKKYESNRARIDTVAKTLTVYDDDCTTVLRTFQLLDANGVPSVESIAERKPIFATDGTVCP